MKKKTSKIHELSLVVDQLKKLKNRYDALDPATKKKVHTGLAAAAALLLGARAVNKARKKRRAREE